MESQFARTELLLGEEAMEKLANARVAIFGIGGVGGYTCEALVRSGIGHFDLIDDDKVCVSNLNRQIIATNKTKICPLAKVMRRELKKRGVKKLKVVYSEDLPTRPITSVAKNEDSNGNADVAMPGEGRKGGGRKDTPGSVAFVPSVAGLIIAGEIVKDLIGINR